jgi:hypothetical protein
MPPVVVLQPEHAIDLGGFLLGWIVCMVPKAVPGMPICGGKWLIGWQWHFSPNQLFPPSKMLRIRKLSPG